MDKQKWSIQTSKFYAFLDTGIVDGISFFFVSVTAIPQYDIDYILKLYITYKTFNLSGTFN